MICNKCGAQNDDNQAFCLKCGSPVQLTADFNLIERELASNIDELMNEIEADKDNDSESNDELKTIDVSVGNKMDMQLKVVDVNRVTSTAKTDVPNDFVDLDNEDNEDYDDDEDYEEEIIPTVSYNSPKTKNKKNSNSKMFAIIGVIVTVVVAIVLLCIFVLGNDEQKDKVKNFNDCYVSAENSYNAGEMDKSLEEAYEALKLVKSSTEEIKARKLIHNIYNKQSFTGAIYFENIEKLIALGDTSEDYYGVIFKKYIEDKNTELLIKLMTTVGTEKAKEYLGENYIEAPVSNMEAGEYINVVALKLTAAEGCKIYYCINDDITKKATEYAGEIIINNKGEHVITAYAVSEQGIPSFTASYTYNVIDGEAEGPVISPASGIYTAPTQITIQVPEGSKVYYTYTKDGEKPSQASAEYTEPIDMRMDAEIFMAIVVDKYGNVSEVTKKQYKFKLKRNESLSSAKEKVWDFYTSSGKVDAEGKLADGSVLTVDYEDAAIIDNAEYYIYRAVGTLTQEEMITTTSITYLAVNTFDGMVIEGLIQAEDEYVLPELKE